MLYLGINRPPEGGMNLASGGLNCGENNRLVVASDGGIWAKIRPASGGQRGGVRVIYLRYWSTLACETGKKGVRMVWRKTL